ncbi:SprT family protein [Lacticaseibacillus porcinae]|uniref:SprT family protein n=1 Tax=Lacticaseibacillus porcinae TaxID=1123687 RepID=UPI000F79AA04|nr:SprT family protein [Lacticaseibacillus porcinae]
MSDQELQALVAEVSQQSFHRPFLNEAHFNPRLKTTGGRFHLKDHNLDFNPKLFAAITRDQQLGIIKHELCHYHLYQMHRGYQHRDADFKALLQAVGGSRFAPSLPRAAKYIYVCAQCGTEYRRQRRIDTRKYACGKCHGKLHLMR